MDVRFEITTATAQILLRTPLAMVLLRWATGKRSNQKGAAYRVQATSTSQQSGNLRALFNSRTVRVCISLLGRPWTGQARTIQVFPRNRRRGMSGIGRQGEAGSTTTTSDNKWQKFQHVERHNTGEGLGRLPGRAHNETGCPRSCCSGG